MLVTSVLVMLTTVHMVNYVWFNLEAPTFFVFVCTYILMHALGTIEWCFVRTLHLILCLFTWQYFSVIMCVLCHGYGFD